MYNLLRFLFFSFLFFIILNLNAQTDTSHYNPEVSGCIRAKYEYNLNTEKHRYEVRNARFSVGGNINPIFEYKAEIDLSDEGVTKMLDAYVRIKALKNLNFTMGQMKIPFSTDNLRSPHQLLFSNRSFIAKRISKNLRDIGLLASYKLPISIPFTLEAGFFNGSGLNNPAWVNTLNYAFRTTIKPLKNLSLTGDYYAGKMDNNDIKMYDIGCSYQIGNFVIEAEYASKNSVDTLLKSNTSHAFFVYGLYHFEFKNKTIRRITPALRYDFYDKDNSNSTFEPGRITAGLTFGFSKLTFADIRLNYEKYYYKTIANVDDKFTIEFIAKF
jgi:hypothetical protein